MAVLARLVTNQFGEGDKFVNDIEIREIYGIIIIIIREDSGKER